MVEFLDEKRISLSSFKKEEQIKGMSKSDIKEFKSQLAAQKESIQKELDIDILLLMDCTSSMSSWIKQSSENLVQILETVKQKCNYKAKIRAAYVGYRDFGDIGDKNHFDIIDYTTDLKKVQDKIKASKASGGGDAPEDVLGALKEAYELKHESPILCVFMICDAPGHGKQYHNCHDNYPNQPD